jgi:predicted TIM-barrel fold metal-dependent hydrolase
VRIDALTIVGPDLFRQAPDLAATTAEYAALGVDGFVAAPGRPIDYHLGPANDLLAEAAAGRTDVARLARVDPNQGERAVAEVERCVTELGCAGVFLHPGEEVFVIRTAVEVTRAAARLGVPVVVASGLYALSEPLQVLDLAELVPEATIVMTTGGQINISGLSMVDAWTAMRRHPNLHVMTNGEYRQDFIERLATQLDARRVLYATFAPSFDRGFETARIANAVLPDDVRHLVEYENAARLFGLRP